MAGVVRRRVDAPPIDDIATQLHGAISRSGTQRVDILRGVNHYLVKLDIGAFGAPGLLRSGDGSVGLLCGEPLLNVGTVAEHEDRLAHLEVLHRAISRGNAAALNWSCGSFSLAHYDPESLALTLATDKVGLRPVYVWWDANYVVFASALRILEAVDRIPKTIDVRGVTEEAAFGFPLADRTAYSTCKVLRSGEYLVASPRQVTQRKYASWDEVPLSKEPLEERTQRIYEAFSRAVTRRRKNRMTNLALLTGGMDSRSVVSGLRQQGSAVFSYGFGHDGSQELVFAEEFARTIGTVHTRLPFPPPGTAPYPARELLPPDQQTTRVIWGGDGGSVGLGHVYLNAAIVDSMRRGAVDSAIRQFCAYNFVNVASRVLSKEVPRPADVIHAGILEELEAARCEDPGRSFHIFLLHNDQRRHLSRHMEDLDINQWEFLSPFFDAEVLTEVIATPIDWCLSHHLYRLFLECFGPATTSVPWQAYPGHEPCPVPIPTQLLDQWRPDSPGLARQTKRSRLLANTRRMLQSREFPDPLLDRTAIRAAYWLTRLRIRDYEYALDAAEVYERHWRNTRLVDMASASSAV